MVTNLCTQVTANEPSPTALPTRFVEPLRISPAARIPGFARVQGTRSTPHTDHQAEGALPAGRSQTKWDNRLRLSSAVIGNLGSSDRFDYTAIGDGVNLASRLEGVNKLYGTGILVSGETVAKVAGAVPMRLVDRVIVKGKSEPVDIYTPCEDSALVEMTARGVAAYRARRWEESELVWREILKRHPQDGVASVYVERISRCRIVAPDVSWQGAVELEKL